MSTNIVILRGNVGKEPTLHQFDNGGCVCNLSIATSKPGYKNKEGKFTKPTVEWHNEVKMYNSMAKSAYKKIQKGDDILIIGELHYNKEHTAQIVVKSYDHKPRIIGKADNSEEGQVDFATDDFLSGLF